MGLGSDTAEPDAVPQPPPPPVDGPATIMEQVPEMPEQPPAAAAPPAWDQPPAEEDKPGFFKRIFGKKE